MPNRLFIIACLATINIFYSTITFSKAWDSHPIYSQKYIENQMLKVFKWQVKHPLKVNLKEDWARAVLYIGAMRAYEFTGDKLYLKKAMIYADSVNYMPGNNFRHADFVARGQVFIKINEVKNKDYMISGIKTG